MPRGAIHGDLFCDNVLFVGDRVSGIIDFGFAATDFLAYDLAITVNDWCVARPDSGALVPELVAALVGAYDAVRPLTPDERAQWPRAAAAAALLLALAALRSPLAAAGRARARARPGPLRTHSARSDPRGRRLAGPRRQPPRTGSRIMSSPPPVIDFVRYS
jgi:Ser/Thr protein kinase RdoA (MazF antagonist)